MSNVTEALKIVQELIINHHFYRSIGDTVLDKLMRVEILLEPEPIEDTAWKMRCI